MPTKLNVKIDKGIMPRSGALNKPLVLFLDDGVIANLDWGDKQSFSIQAGRHTNTLKTRQGGMFNTLSFEAVDGDAITLYGFFDRENHQLSLLNMAEVSSTETQSITRNRRSSTGQRIVTSSTGICAGLGMVIGAFGFNILNFTTRGAIPGGYIGTIMGICIGIFVGAFIGLIIGLGIRAIYPK
jgi:hypothetical protein